MLCRAMLYDIETFGPDNKFKKAVFLDSESMDKVSAMVNDVQFAELAPLKGKKGDFKFNLAAKGYDYSIKFVSFTPVA